MLPKYSQMELIEFEVAIACAAQRPLYVLQLVRLQASQPEGITRGARPRRPSSNWKKSKHEIRKNPNDRLKEFQTGRSFSIGGASV